ncbi:MAG TPA: hypothetical protein VFW83_07335 [Bryobacteraceae bacterium]|nr:hypothetical protein [Bryobacteraceae bacterium]
MMPDESMPLTDYSEDGVDLTLIRWFLSLTPAERLAFVERQTQDHPVHPKNECPEMN